MFNQWSAAQLAHALGYRIDLVGNDARLCGHRRWYGYVSMHKTLSRLARMKHIDPAAPPADIPKALRDGCEQ